jgi:soluble lytic murein transglycosylase-like protein
MGPKAIAAPLKVLAGAVLLLAGVSLIRADSLCAYKTESGAIVYTNAPTKDGVCAAPAKAPPVPPPSMRSVEKYDAVIKHWAHQYGVSPKLVHAVVATESAYNPGAISPKGARGLMQLMPETARRYGVKDSYNASENIRGGVAHLRELLDAFNGDTRLAVAAYNAGSQAVIKHSGVPPYQETRDYVRRVIGRMDGSTVGLANGVKVAGTDGSIELRTSSTGSPLLIN